MQRLVWKTGFAKTELPLDLTGDEAHAHEQGIEELNQVLRERVNFSRGPLQIPSDGMSFGPDFSTGRSRLFHGWIEGLDTALEALQILERFQKRRAVLDYVLESNVAPPPPDPESPHAGPDPKPWERWVRHDLSSWQTYLEQAPHGVGARYAWTFAGGRGQSVTLVDLELGFDRYHEDLRRAAKNSPSAPDHFHGTMSLGVCCGDENSFGITGIAPRAEPELVTVLDKDDYFYDYPLASMAIWGCMNRLSGGDVILLELQADYLTEYDDLSARIAQVLPIERSPDVAQAIGDATRAGIYVVEAAGNGGLSLNGVGLPRDSGAILVGAGAPETLEWVDGTNYGDRVDVHGWGERVVSTASDDKDWADFCRKLGLPAWTRCYTQHFNGTSSAAAMVAGVVACLSGIMQTNGYGILTPAEMRTLLVNTGRPCGGSNKIGPLPNLESAIAMLQDDYGPLKRVYTA